MLILLVGGLGLIGGVRCGRTPAAKSE